MKRTVIALCAFALIAGFGFGLGVTPAAAYVANQTDWLSGVGQREAAAPSRAQRSNRATRQRAQRVATSEQSDRPQTRRGTRGRTTSASLTGGSGFGSGIASYYWQPQRVASGGWFNPNAMTAAHKTLPFGTRVRVTNLNNGRTVTVTINDRGPYIRGRVIDLSRAAASAVGMTGSGIARVSMSIAGRS